MFITIHTKIAIVWRKIVKILKDGTKISKTSEIA
jgi:hypothetical protein